MKKTYEGYWFRSHRGSSSMWYCALYKEDKYYSHYDESELDGPTDGLVTVKGNEKLLDQSEIIEDLSGFLEVGMKYRINVEIKENKYYLEIEVI